MAGLAFICGIAALFILVFLWEGLRNKEEMNLNPTGLLRWLISGNWPAKVGAVLLLISTGALLRFLILTIEFPATGKLGVGIFAVSVLGAFSAYLHDSTKRRAIHLALGGAALGAAYLTAYSAYGYFNFITSIQALGLLFIVACAATAFALESRAQSIAILAMAGAFIAPAFALTSPGVLPVYGYYFLASSLVLLMVALRGWRPLIHLSFLFTLAGALFFGWTQKFYEPAYFSQMHPLLLALVAIHLLMPLMEWREVSNHDTQGDWLRRFDRGYFLLLPLVSALLMSLLAPNEAVEGAIGLLELSLLWVLAAGIQHWRFHTGGGRYAAVAMILGFVSALLAFQDIPYLLMAASLSCALMAASRRLRIADGGVMALAVSALAFSACFIVQSLLEPAISPPFFNREYLYSAILSVSLLLAAYGSRTHQNRKFTSLYFIFAITWLAIASVRELITMNLDYLPQLGYLVALFASAAYGVLTIKRAPSMTTTLLLGFAMYLSGMFCARLLNPAMLFTALLAGQFVFLCIAHATGRHLKADGEVIADIARTFLPVLIFPFAGAYSEGVNAPHLNVIMTFLVSSALLASLHAQLTIPKGSFWPNTLSPVGFILFGLLLFYKTVFHIERNSWASAYELIALLYIVQTVLSLQRSKNRDANVFSIVAILALVTTSAAMFLRVFGPPGTLTILAINQMLLPTMVSLFWAIIGGLMTWWAMRIQSRWLWVLGSLLLVASAIKLVLFDFESLGQLGNILAMMAAGCVFMAVAWLAPFPPKRKEPIAGETHAQKAALAPGQVRPTAEPPSSRENHQTTSRESDPSRTWIWILVGLTVIFFIYHSGARRSSKPHVYPAVQTRINNSEVPQQAPTSSEVKIQASAPQGTNDILAAECSKFIAQLPKDNYEVYAALQAAQIDAPTSSEMSPRIIDIKVHKPGKNVLLILSSNEWVTWSVLPPANRVKIIGVVLSGQSIGTIYGLSGQVPILRSTFGPGSPCGNTGNKPGDIQGIFSFTNQYLNRDVNEVATPKQTRVDFGVSLADSQVDEMPAAGIAQKSMIAPYGISCAVPEWGGTSCSGNILATGSMNNSDSPAVAAEHCRQSGVAGSCCMFHLYGVGKWFLTDGQPQAHRRECDIEPNGYPNSCNAGGACTANRSSGWVR